MYSAWVDKETPSNEKVHLVLQFVIISEILVGIYFRHNGLTENCALFSTRRVCMYHAVCVIVIWSLVFAACIVFQTMNNVFWVVILYVGESYYYVVSSIFKVKVMAKCQWTQSKSWGNACCYSKLCCNSFYHCGKYPIIQTL